MTDHPIDIDPGIVLAGARERPLAAADLRRLPWQEHTLAVTCSSGSEYTATWSGVGVLDALDLVGIPADTTHVVVTAADGYRVCVDLHAALDAIVALTKDDDPIRASEAYATRLVAPAIGGTRTVKDIDRIEPIALEPGASPEAVEDLQLEAD